MTFVRKTSYVKRSRKHRYIKPFALLLAAVMLLGLSGCSKNETSQEDFEPVPVPEGGWTVERLSKTIRINGEPLPEPFTVDNLGEKYSFEPSSISDSGTLKFEKKDIAVIVFDDESENPDDLQKDIIKFAFNTSGNMDVKEIYVNGITLGSSAVEAIKAFGEPSEKTSQNVWVYYENGKSADDNIIVLWLDDENNISWISIRF